MHSLSVWILALFVSSAASFSAKTRNGARALTPLSVASAANARGRSQSISLSAATSVNGADASESTEGLKKNRVAVLLCPAQFCVPADYVGLFEDLKRQDRGEGAPEIGMCRVAPLPRTEWIKVARSLPTRSFLEAKLPVHSTLSWYFDAMETALSDIYASEGTDVNICIIGHSIGGWVARAYLGGLSGSSSAVYRLTQRRCTSFITIGTPHSSPETALVDQTRGLLNEIAQSPECSPEALAERGIEITCVGSSGVDGAFLTANVEELVAASSYLPLLGRLGKDVRGDGIVPSDLAFMAKPARVVEVSECDITGVPVRHAHVIPTPWNLLDGSSPSIALPEEFAWYGSAGVLPQWAKYVR